MLIFLDDKRLPFDCYEYMKARIGSGASVYNGDWTIARDYDEFKKVVDENYGDILIVSFDHDLADEHYNPIGMVNDDEYDVLRETFVERTGEDCAEYLIEKYKNNAGQFPICLVHSMNPVGRQHITNKLRDHGY